MRQKQYPRETRRGPGLNIKYSKYFTRELHLAFKAECARRELRMSRVMARLVRKWLTKKQRWSGDKDSQRWI